MHKTRSALNILENIYDKSQVNLDLSKASFNFLRTMKLNRDKIVVNDEDLVENVYVKAKAHRSFRNKFYANGKLTKNSSVVSKETLYQSMEK